MAMTREDLVKRLRYCSEEQSGCGLCALSSDCVLRIGLLTQAADAIEELSKLADEIPRVRRLWSHGHWDELSPECQTCQNRKIMSVKMDGNHFYCCGKYPLRVGDKCPKYEPEPPKEEA